MVVLPLLFACSDEPAPPQGLRYLTVAGISDEMAMASERPRIYNFWATWCGPCVQELPLLRDYARARTDVELVLVNVDLPSLKKTRVEPLVRRLDLEAFEHLAVDDPDPAYALMSLPGWPQSVPVTLIVDAAGQRVRQFNVSVDRGMLDRAIDEATR